MRRKAVRRPVGMTKAVCTLLNKRLALNINIAVTN